MHLAIAATMAEVLELEACSSAKGVEHLQRMHNSQIPWVGMQCEFETVLSLKYLWQKMLDARQFAIQHTRTNFPLHR